jgi:N-acetyl-anhydromuramyl-L-alanine amidase AmpD
MITRSTVVVGVQPTITPDQFEQVLVAAGSPAASAALEGYAYIVGTGVDPCFILAIFQEESHMATDLDSMVILHKTLNPGNCRSSSIGPRTIVPTERGSFVRYNNWGEGFLDAANRLVDKTFPYVLEGRKTIEQIIERWAPSKDGNNPEGYIANVVKFMNGWISQGSNSMTAVPNQTDIGFPVRVHWAFDTGPNRALNTVNTFVVHDTEGGMASDEPTLANNDGNIASCHALIAPDGELVFMVPLETTAWTPGNDLVAERSINVEISGFAVKGYTDAQYRSVAAFFNWCIAQGCPIPAVYVGKSGTAGIIGHQDVPNPFQPGKFGGASGHTDPGPLFDWGKLLKYIKDGGINKVTSGSNFPKPAALPYGVTVDSAGALIFPGNIPLNFGFKDAYLTLFGNVPVGDDLGAAIIRGAKQYGLPVAPETVYQNGSVQDFELCTFRFNKDEAPGWQVRLFKKPVAA